MARTALGRLTAGLIGGIRRGRAVPTETLGDIGVSVTGGIVDSGESDASLQGESRYKTFSELMANVSIVAAATRHFLNLVAKAEWKFTPSETDTSGEFAELAEKMLTDDPDTSWHRVVRRAAMYRFYGFSVQEWTARRDAEGRLTFADVAPRAQRTIDRWDIDPETGRVRGVVQRSPSTFREIYLPRTKLVYIVDDTLNDSPEGLGLLRHVVKGGKELQVLENLEKWGFETDLRGFPIGRAPLQELRDKVESGSGGGLTKTQMDALVNPIKEFVRKHIRTEANQGLLLDSATYRALDEKQTPSDLYKFGVELLQGSGNAGHEAVGRAIIRKTQEIARVLSAEGLLLGSDGTGSLALSKQKANDLSLVVDSTLKELKEGLEDDLLKVLWLLNGWDEDLMPEMKPESVQFKDVEAIAATLRDMAAAGAMLGPDDPAIAELYGMMGLTAPDPGAVALDASLAGSARGRDGGIMPGDEIPDRESDTGGER